MATYGKLVDEKVIWSGPARILFAYRYDDTVTTPDKFFPTRIADVIDLTDAEPEDPVGYWLDIGNTDGGTTVTIHSPLTEIRTDQQTIGFDRTDASATISTTMAENSFRNMQLAFAEDNVTRLNPQPSPDETVWDVDLDDSVPQRVMAVIAKKRNGKKRLFAFHTVQIEGGDISIPLTPGGGLAHIPVSFRALRRENLVATMPKLFRIFEQSETG